MLLIFMYAHLHPRYLSCASQLCSVPQEANPHGLHTWGFLVSCEEKGLGTLLPNSHPAL